MAETFSLESVKEFIIEKGGKVTNHEIVKHFKVFLNDKNRQKEVRALFKEYVGAVASVKHEDVKYLVLRPEFCSAVQHDEENVKSTSESSYSLSSSSNDGMESEASQTAPTTDNLQLEGSVSPIVHSHSSPSILQAIDSSSLSLPLQDCYEENSQSCCSESQSTPLKWFVEPPEGETPLPPPRRKGSAKGKENRDLKIQERMQLLCEEKETEANSAKKEINEFPLSPGSVKERAKSLNKMASECDLNQKVNGSLTQNTSKKREGKSERGGDDDDISSVSSIDNQKREWIIKASKADYMGLVRLLKEEPKLAHFKTSLHWAAKHGNADVIKLIAGTHRANPNVRSVSGYTPLHLAAMFCHEEIMEILIHSYGADPNMRDYSGKKPHQYLPASIISTYTIKNIKTLFSLFTEYEAATNYCVRPSLGVPDVNFMRIGSLNAKVQKTIVGTGKSSRLTRLKSWGSADNLSDLLASKMMPPPKSAPPKKKKLKKPMTNDRESNSFGKGKMVEVEDASFC
ncbi:ankyrin repeat domain-containing protein SOWAHC-like [Centruroides vittatus]|uniref:ankyrin repeat domain-containing protein SOWAHC-like n=1 Tax=Centruroides vittatus TaxID=120091 RepID=UPI003510536F